MAQEGAQRSNESARPAGTRINTGFGAFLAKKMRESVDPKMRPTMYPAPPRKAEDRESEDAGCKTGKTRVAKLGFRFDQRAAGNVARRAWRKEDRSAARRVRRATESSRVVSKRNCQKLENDVDAETGPAKVTLPLITADSQVSEWFCEHAATASVSKRSIGRREARLERRCETGQSSLIVWFSEFLGRWALKQKASAEEGIR
jgi:hypothetical protein